VVEEGLAVVVAAQAVTVVVTDGCLPPLGGYLEKQFHLVHGKLGREQ
jgi:hypothetical protein